MRNEPSNKMSESSNLSRSPTSETMLSKYRVSEFQEEKVRNDNQLQNFYMPYMKRIYEQMKTQNPNIRPPEDLLVNSQLLSMKEADMARKIQTLHKDNEAKQGRIREMVKQIGTLVKRLKPFDPSITETNANVGEDNERTAKRYESLMKIKADETFFALKMKGIDLLKEFGLLKEEAEGINHMQTDSEVFDFILNKLKLRVKDYKSRQKQSTETNYKERAELNRYSERIQYMAETNEQLKTNEQRLKQKIEEVKKEWSSACDRLILKQKQLEERDNEIFRLKRAMDEKESSIVMTATRATGDRDMIEMKCRDLEQQLRDMRVLLSMYNLEKSELQATIDEKQSELEENRIRDKFNQEEYEKVLRESARWRERYEWMERDRDTKSKLIQKQNFRLDNELKMIKVQLESQKIKYTQLQTETEELKLLNKRIHEDLIQKELENQRLQKKCSELDDSLKTRIKQIEEEYLGKYRNLEKQRDTQIQNSNLTKQEEFRKEWRLLDQDWTMKIEQLHKSYDAKLALQTAAHNRTLDELSKVQVQYLQLLEQAHRQKGSMSKTHSYQVVSPKNYTKQFILGSKEAVLQGQAYPNFINHLIHSPSIKANPESNPLTPQTPSEPPSATKTQSRYRQNPGQNGANFVGEPNISEK